MRSDDIRNRNKERRDAAIRAVRKVNPGVEPVDCAFDRPRENKNKQKLLDQMRVKENEIQRKQSNL